jgi:hypothetical protein
VGSGKTTELLAVKAQLPEIDDGMRGMYIDVSNGQDIARMTPGAIIVQAGLALSRIAPEGDAVSKATTRLYEIAHGYWDEEGPHVDEPPPGEHIAGLLTPVAQIERSVHRALLPFRELLSICRARHQHLVVMLDGLDRLNDVQTFDRMVTHDIEALKDEGVGVVLVGPLRALYGLDRVIAGRFDSLHYQPWIDVSSDIDGISHLARILIKRDGADAAFSSEATGALVSASGGVVRDLLTLAQSACVEAYMDGADQVGAREVFAAIDTFGRKHLQGLRPAEIEVLQRVRNKGIFVQTSEEDLALLMTRRVLEYRNDGQLRYGIHPTTEKLLAAIGAP